MAIKKSLERERSRDHMVTGQGDSNVRPRVPPSIRKGTHNRFDSVKQSLTFCEDRSDMGHDVYVRSHESTHSVHSLCRLLLFLLNMLRLNDFTRDSIRISPSPTTVNMSDNRCRFLLLIDLPQLLSVVAINDIEKDIRNPNPKLGTWYPSTTGNKKLHVC